MATPNSEPGEAHDFFVDTWAVYKKLVAENYMFHRQLYAGVASLLQTGQIGEFSLLDLGCGDAANLAPILKNSPISHYSGVDLSAVALELARDTLAELGNRVSLHCADMMAFMDRDSTTYDVIFSSYALHHLDRPAKQAFLSRCRQHLNPNGQFILIDIVRQSEDNADRHVDRYCETMRSEWTRLTPRELSYVTEHVRQFDRPESLPELKLMSELAGFAAFNPVSHQTQHHLIRFLTR